MKHFYPLLLSVLIAFSLNAQKNVTLTISPLVDGNALQMETNLTDLAGVVFSLSHFDYYVSNIHIIHDGGQDILISDTVFLVEPSNHVLNLGVQNVTTIEQISFSIGVPPNMNTESGVDAIDITSYPVGHPLSFQDPAMHWGWTAGYTHMIIGGPVDTDNDGVTNAGFQLHNLGDINYFSTTLAVIQTNTSVSEIDIFINCNVDVWLKNIDISTVGILHGSTHENRDVMRNVEIEPVFNQTLGASLSDLYTKVGKVYFSNNAEIITVIWENVKGAQEFSLTDISGKVVSKGSVAGLNGTRSFENLSNGIYQFHLFDANSNELNSLKIAK